MEIACSTSPTAERRNPSGPENINCSTPLQDQEGLFILSILSLAIYLLYNFIVTLPREIFESAFLDGATHYTVFYRLVVPLSMPALVSFAVFQFLWVWNGALISLVFLGQHQREVLPQRILSLLGVYGNDWYLLTADAFVSMVIPLIVFLGLQRYFIRGLMAGSVKS